MKKIIFFLLLSSSTAAQCDTSLRPVVFIHGFLASGDTWSSAVHFFKQAGYCEDRLYAFDWNSIAGSGKKTEQQLAQFIDRVLSNTGARQIDLVGHSAGGGLARNFLKDSQQAAKVSHYVHVGSRSWTGSYSWFPNNRCLTIFSSGDKVTGNSAGPTEGASNLALTDEDHYQVATGEASLKTMLQFFYPEKRELISTPIEKKVSIAGKAVLLGDNRAMSGAKINLYSLRKSNGHRKTIGAITGLSVTDAGEWGPVTVKPGHPYEIELVPADSSKRKISYFFPSFTHSDPLVYLRGIPEGTRMMAMLGTLPEKDDQSLLVLYSATGAMIGGRDSVTINGTPVCSPTLTPAAKTVISSFIFDDGDQISSGKTLKQFNSIPFIGGVDLLLPAGRNKSIDIFWNGKRMKIPSLSSKERILLLVVRP
jgi:triacylglycerol lipase